MQNEKILHISERLSPDSDGPLIGTPTKPEGPDLVPTSDNNMNDLWEKGEKESSATGVAPANVTSAQSSQGDRTDGIASNQSVVNSDGKGNALSSDKQAEGGKSLGNRLKIAVCLTPLPHHNATSPRPLSISRPTPRPPLRG